MKRSEKIRLSELAKAQEAEESAKDPAGREAARREWGETRKAAREAFLERGDWMSILNDFKERDGYYSPNERARMCRDFADELVNRTSQQRREQPATAQR